MPLLCVFAFEGVFRTVGSEPPEALKCVADSLTRKECPDLHTVVNEIGTRSCATDKVVTFSTVDSYDRQGGQEDSEFLPLPPLTIPLNPLKPTKVGDLSDLVRLAVQQCRPEYELLGKQVQQ